MKPESLRDTDDAMFSDGDVLAAIRSLCERGDLPATPKPAHTPEPWAVHEVGLNPEAVSEPVEAVGSLVRALATPFENVERTPDFIAAQWHMKRPRIIAALAELMVPANGVVDGPHD